MIRHSFLWPLLREPFICAVLALALCTAAYTAEILRGGLLAIPPGQIEAGQACGMSRWLLLRRIIAPVMLRYALPAYSTEAILLVKSTALASLGDRLGRHGGGPTDYSAYLPDDGGISLRGGHLPAAQFHHCAIIRPA
ncbi:amino acid ABC transporter permease [Klebsiella quasipneumoniae]|nr:amino acid ABC transporter permease [Klebsiella quasipneumoniae]